MTPSAVPSMATATASTTIQAPSSTPAAPGTPAKRVFTAEEKRVCSIEATKNGEECEACQ